MLASNCSHDLPARRRSRAAHFNPRLRQRTAFSAPPPPLTFYSVVLQYHQVNAEFVDGPLRNSDLAGGELNNNGTYIGSMGLKLYNATVQIDVAKDGSMTGTPPPPRATQPLSSPGTPKILVSLYDCMHNCTVIAAVKMIW